MSHAPTKLFVVENGFIAELLRPALGEGWLVVSYGTGLMGHRFDHVVFRYPDKDLRGAERSMIQSYLDDQVRLKLAPAGKLVLL